MAQDHAKELEDLEQLIAEPGWARLQAYAGEVWGLAAFREQVGRALATGADRDAVARLDAAHDAVEALLRYPRTRVAKLRALQETAAARSSGTWPRGGAA